MAKAEGNGGSLPSRKVNEIRSHTGPINALTFSSPPQQTYLLSGSSDRTIHLHRAEPTTTSTTTPITTKPIQTYSGAHGYAVLSLSCSSDNTTFASSGGDRTGPFLWDVSAATTLRRFGANSSHAHTARIPCVTFGGESDSVLISGSDDRSVRVWDTKSRDARPVAIWEDARDGITDIKVCSPAEILTSSVDGRLRTYDLRMGRLTTDVMPAPIVSLDLSFDGSAVLVGCLDSRLRLLDRREGTLLQSFGSGAVDGAATAATAGAAGGKRLADDANFHNTSLRLTSALNPNTSLAVVGTESSSHVYAYDVLSGACVTRLDTSSSPSSSSSSPPPTTTTKSSEKDSYGGNQEGLNTGNPNKGKCISCVAFRRSNVGGGGGGGSGQQQEVWACAGVEGVVSVYAR